MGRTSLQNMQSVLDPLQAWNWDITFPRIPGTADTRQMTYRAVSTSIPGTSLEDVTWEGHGIKLHYAGKRRYADSWTIDIIEVRDASSRDMLLNWVELARSWVNNSGSYKSTYAVPVEVSLYDDIPNDIRDIQLVNAFPTAIGDVTLDQGSDIIKYQVTLAFDLFIDVTPAAQPAPSAT